MPSSILSSLASVGLCLGLAAACSSNSSSGSGTLTGKVASTTFSVASELAQVATTGPLEDCTVGAGDASCVPVKSTGQTVLIALTNRADVDCSALVADYGSNFGFSNLDVLFIDLDVMEGTVTPGTYTYSGGASGKDMTANFTTMNATCATAINAPATGGSVTITAISGTSVSGTFDLTFAQGSFSGSFSSPICDVGDAATHEKSDAATCN